MRHTCAFPQTPVRCSYVSVAVERQPALRRITGWCGATCHWAVFVCLLESSIALIDDAVTRASSVPKQDEGSRQHRNESAQDAGPALMQLSLASAICGCVEFEHEWLQMPLGPAELRHLMENCANCEHSLVQH